MNGDKRKLDAEGSFSVLQTGADQEFSVQVQISAAERLKGDEAIRLTLDNKELDKDSPSDVARIDEFENCGIDGLVEKIDASGACIDEEDAKVALFTFDVGLSGAYNKGEQEYFYKFDSNKTLEEGYTIDQVWVDGRRIETPAAEGQFSVPQTGADQEFSVQVQISAAERLKGDEELKLTLDNQPTLGGKSPNATARIDDFENCGIDGLVEKIDARGACIDEEDAKVALFTFDVGLSGA